VRPPSGRTHWFAPSKIMINYLYERNSVNLDKKGQARGPALMVSGRYGLEAYPI